MARSSNLTDERLAALYVGEGFGGNNTMRAKVIRELIDEIRALRTELAAAGSSVRIQSDTGGDIAIEAG